MIQRTRRQNKISVSLRAQSVGRADLAAFAATNHSPIQSLHYCSPDWGSPHVSSWPIQLSPKGQLG
jgi:hypothetical protein